MLLRFCICLRRTTFPKRFAHDVSIMCYCYCSALMQLLCQEQMNKYHIRKFIETD